MNSNGQLDYTEIRNVFNVEDKRHGDEIFKKIIEEIDEDGDLFISLGEFQNHM